MSKRVARRSFLQIAPAAASLASYAAQTPAPSKSAAKAARKASDVTISSVAYTPILDYPIQPKHYSEVTLKDNFWKPKITTNAEVTIPFEVKKLSESSSGRGFGG